MTTKERSAYTARRGEGSEEEEKQKCEISFPPPLFLSNAKEATKAVSLFQLVPLCCSRLSSSCLSFSSLFFSLFSSRPLLLPQLVSLSLFSPFSLSLLCPLCLLCLLHLLSVVSLSVSPFHFALTVIGRCQNSSDTCRFENSRAHSAFRCGISKTRRRCG